MCVVTKAVVDIMRAAVEPLIPQTSNRQPAVCHRARASHRVCLRGFIIGAVTGCSWVIAEALLDCGVSDATLRRRRDGWIAAGIFDKITTEAITRRAVRALGIELGSTHRSR